MSVRAARHILLASCAAFAAICAVEIVWSTGRGADPDPPLQSPAELVLRPPANIDAMVAEIVARPLFRSDRQPAAAADADDDDSGDKKTATLQSRLAGISVGPVREALFERDGEKAVAVREGAEIDGFKVSSIQIDRVVLTSAAGQQTVQLTADASARSQGKRPAQARRAGANPAVAANGQQRPQPNPPSAGPQAPKR